VRPFDETDNAAYAVFQSRFRARYASDPTPLAAYYYDAVRLLVHSMDGSGLNRPGLRDAIAEAQGFVGATGRISWDNGGGNRARPVLLLLAEPEGF
jgi:ABC-type branched-subunit amino acid transport system substrate-binding protein